MKLAVDDVLEGLLVQVVGFKFIFYRLEIEQYHWKIHWKIMMIDW